jgi:hypothetical protein
LAVDHVSGGWQRNFNADRLQSTASVFKIVSLIAYAQAVVDGRINPSEVVNRNDWARFWMGYDGGALNNAWQRLGRPTTVTVDQLVGAMMRESDNAAPDWLRDRLGTSPISSVISRYVPGHFDFPLAVSGQFVSWFGYPTEFGRGDRLASTYSNTASDRFRGEIGTAFTQLHTPSFVASARQLRCVNLPWEPPLAGCTPRFDVTDASLRKLLGFMFTRSSARTLTRLMRGVLERTLLPPAVQTIVERHLEWRLSLPNFQAAFTRHGAKDGFLGPQDVLNWTTYQQSRASGQRLVASIFIRQLPAGAFTVDDVAGFVEEILFNPSFATQVQTRIPAPIARAELVATKVGLTFSTSRTTAQVEIHNAGTASSVANSDIRLVRSTDTVYAVGDPLISSSTLGILAPGAKKVITLQGTVGIPAGQYALVAFDTNNRTPESDEGNNRNWERR